ncbi:EAL domain-containing protein [Roseisolibacter sp. H3M3-2]|uniref:EAL and HDOD domain-containing protein n=1 Tax=Roseisolibacter sp. H3M3-2 TaxID=3031323 RepID=UPI0023DAE3BE|nr:EAL domain-containing protein [Roseisolibacter sp. H3M3-2]MDF1503746.1 EAL domain-containing protein [Roseisolibacter sp. H3M3-2]
MSLFSRFSSSAPKAPAALAAAPAPASAPTAVATAPAADPAGIHDVFVARQPIFDERDRLFAYELLYRSGTTQNFANGVSADQMCTDTVIHALLSIGLSPLTGGTLAFVNMTRDFLLSGQYQLFEPKSVVIELLESVEPEPEVIAACTELRRRGYTLALDDFVNAPGYEPLIRLAQIIKLDVLNKSEAEVKRAADDLRKYGVRLLAERVETAEVRDMCRRHGYTLFQGYYYSRPQIVSHRELSVEHSTMVRLLNLLEDQKAGDAEIENAFKGDPSLSYKLLRIANSAAFGGRDVTSIGFALRMVGRAVLHRWLTVLLVSSVASNSGIGHELVLAALVRARLAELVGERTGRRSQMGPLFLVGLFSLLDALLRMPMQGILERMAIAQDVKDALLTRSGPYAGTLALVEAQERGDWSAVVDAAESVALTPAQVSGLYTEALAWAGERTSSWR